MNHDQDHDEAGLDPDRDCFYPDDTEPAPLEHPYPLSRARRRRAIMAIGLMTAAGTCLIARGYALMRELVDDAELDITMAYSDGRARRDE